MKFSVNRSEGRCIKCGDIVKKGDGYEYSNIALTHSGRCMYQVKHKDCGKVKRDV